MVTGASLRRAAPFSEILSERAGASETRIAYRFLSSDEAEETLTFGQLHRASLRFAARLSSLCKPGDRAVLFYPQGLEFIVAFFACMHAGVIAVPVSVPGRRSGNDTLRGIIRDSGSDCVLGPRALLDKYRDALEPEPRATTLWLAATDEWALDRDAGGAEPPCQAIDVALLQYTSGSTGNPRGVVITRDNLIDNCRQQQLCLGVHPGSVAVSWLPMFHDMGLGTVLGALLSNIPCTLLAPAAFLQKPRRWLEAISRFRASVSGGPNFAYDLCVQRIAPEEREGLDLSSWSAAYSGSEPVRAHTLERFEQAFARAGFRREAFRPMYGLAEATLFVTGSGTSAPPVVQRFSRSGLEQGEGRPDESAEAQPLVGCGHTWLDTRVTIVDPETRVPRAPGQVGEIWIAGPCVAGGYWRKDAETRATFQGFTALGEGPYLRSGDLGFSHEGSLFVTGRAKDLIIIRGRNHYPEDVETTVSSAHAALEPGRAAAFSIEDDAGEKLVVVQELKRSALRKRDDAAIFDAVRAAVARQHGVQAYAIALIGPTLLPRTTSGKVRRRACRQAFLERRLNAVASSIVEPSASEPAPLAAPPPTGSDGLAAVAARVEPVSRDELRAWLVATLAHKLGVGVERIDTGRSFADHGVDSLTGVELAKALSERCSTPLDETLLWSLPTIDAVVERLTAPPPLGLRADGAGQLAAERQLTLDLVRLEAELGQGDAPARSQVLAALRGARHQLELVRAQQTEPIAIVGIGCRLPGGAATPEALWRLLADGVDATGDVPRERWDADALYDPDPDAPGKAYVKRGAFLERIDGFDADFFDISPREALGMDPQQRLLLEVAWEALEDAGIPPGSLRGSATGVWLGLCLDDYSRRSVSSGDLSRIDPYSALGNSRSIAAGRIAYVLDLRGPAIQIDTACSSSLVAVDQACRSLRSGETSVALVGGVSLLSSPESMIALCKLRALAPDGRCKTFDAAADGYARGEGSAMVVLKRLSDAERAGDRIYAVVRGSATNHDGHSNGITAPSGAAQAAVIRAALAQASIDPRAVDYVETHGTGTLLGDPIEVAALGEVYCAGRPPSEPLWLGTIKSNIGHLEGAAGIAGLAKAALCLAHGALPRHLHLAQPNPKIPWGRLPVRVPRSTEAWPRGERPRHASVSSFGISGTNAHVVLGEAPAPAATPAAVSDERSAELVVLSAKSPEALLEQARRLHAHVSASPQLALGALAFSLLTTRASLPHRLALAVPGRAALLERLEEVIAAGVPSAEAASGAAPRIVFVFPGQGSQWLGMGRELLRDEPSFREAMAACDRALSAELGWSVLDELRCEQRPARLDAVEVVQPLLFAFQVSLAALWRAWGVVPDAVVGHSMGEVAAAVVAGALSLEAGARVTCCRSRLLQRIAGQGEMALVELSLADAEAAIAGFEGELAVAVSNSPSSTVLSGAPAALARVLARLEARGVFHRRIKVSVASHSPQVDPLLLELVSQLGGLEAQPFQRPMYSTVMGRRLEPGELTARYWADNLRQPVRFARSVEALLEQGFGAFVELSPHPILTTALEAMRSRANAAALVVGSLQREQPERLALLESLGALHVHGLPLSGTSLFPRGARREPLPRYPWQHQRFWLEPVAEPGGAPPRAAVDGALYRVEWQVAELPVAAPPSDVRCAVLRESGPARAQALVAELSARGVRAELVSLAELATVNVEQLVCAWQGGDAAAALELTTTALALVQHVMKRPRPPRLWWLTRGAVATAAGEGARPALAALWGFGRSVMLEHPELACTLLDGDDDGALAAALVRELGAPPDENQIAWRSGVRRVARLAALPSDTVASPARLRLDGTLFISGGLGGLGLELARSLAARGAAHLVLAGRRGLDTAGAPGAIAELEAAGTRVTIAALDVADRDALARMLEALPAELPLRGVFHAAAVLDDGVVAEQTPERLARVLSPKALGAWHLHELTRGLELDAFVLFSSISGTWGSAGQAGYAAANAFLDALAAERRAEGATALSVAWGLWAERGLAARLDAAHRARFARSGLELISPARGLALLDRALALEEAQLVAAPLDRRVAARVFGDAVPPLWRALLPAAARAVQPPSELAQGLARMQLEQRRSAVQDVVRAEVAKVLSRASASAVPLERPLKELGLDSLMALELRTGLGRRFGVALPATLAFDRPTVRAIAEHLLGELAPAQPAEPVPLTAPLDEPIAIVGVGCRLPGGVTDLESFWALLDEERDAIVEVPAERWDIDAWYDPDPAAAGKMYTRWGGFVPGIEAFDAAFFGLSPREASGVDPQARLLLETSWEALEHAGITPASLAGSATGVYVGICGNEYQARALAQVDASDPYPLLGTLHSTVVGRLSYWLGLKGPSVPVDTACSSSLVAVHLACQALRAGECSTAFAGGVNIVLGPEPTVQLSRLRALSASGRCRAFSADADGFVRSDGAGVLILERLSDARARGHRVLGLIRGSAVNQDGRSNGLTAPNGPSQQAVIAEALRRARVSPGEVGYVECHGTGTELGDPIEVQALAAALSHGVRRERPVLIGSLKSNVGHMEGAAGVGGLIKALLALSRERVPRSLHFSAPNPHVAWSELPVAVAHEATAWPRTSRPRFAGVSSFGIGGTNAHVVLEEAPGAPQRPSTPARAAELIVLSARSETALRERAARLQAYLATRQSVALPDVSAALLGARSALEERLAFSVTSRDELQAALELAARGGTPPGGSRARAPESRGKVAWLFTGQGAQRPGMGRELYEEWPAFARALDDALAHIDAELERPLREVMWAEPGSEGAALLEQTAFAQPALFAFEWALAALWRSLGVEPDIVAGHSLGELSAAAVAGVLSLADAARLVCARGRSMQALPAGGVMLSVAAGRDEVEPLLAPFASSVAIAALNAPRSTVISGAEAAVRALGEALARRQLSSTPLAVSHAFHSPLLEPMLAAFGSVVRSIELRAPRLPLVSNLRGEVAGAELAEPEYWVRHVREPVLFADGVRALERAGASVFMELGPRSQLLGLVSATLAAPPAALIASVRADGAETRSLLQGLGAWICAGGEVRREGLCSSAERSLELPPYPWQRARHWIDAAPPQPKAAAGEVEALLRRLLERGTLPPAARAALPELLAALGDERSRERTAEWLYRLAWRPVAEPAERIRTRERWALLGPSADAERLATALRRSGGTPVIVPSLEALDALSGANVSRIVHVLSGAPRAEEEMLALVRRLSALRGTAPRAWWFTRAAVGTSASDPPSQPEQATLWGLGRDLALERPELWGGIVDLPRGELSPRLAERVLALLVERPREDQLALRADAGFVLRLARQPRTASRATAPSGSARSGKGTALVTGGLGGIGLHVARWLAQRGQTHLLLVGRQGHATPGAERAVAELTALGAQVSVAAGDVADRESMRRVLQAIPAELPLRAVFHVAGVNDYTPLDELTNERVAEVLAAKREGTLVLDELTQGSALEAFVCFSSIAAAWGSVRQAAYAAANAFQQAWAAAARAAGRPAFAIAWGTWAESGMLDSATRAQLSRHGLRAMAPERALAALDEVLAAPMLAVDAPAALDPCSAIADVDWRSFRKTFEIWGPRALLAELTDEGESLPSGAIAGVPVVQDRSSELRALPVEHRRATLTLWLQQEVARVLSWRGAELPAADRSLRDLGLDSLMAVELRAALGQRLGAPLPVTVAFDAMLSTPATLAERLLRVLFPENADHSARESDYERDARLDVAVQGPRHDPAAVPARVLLTGATGFLGAFLLAELLERTRAHVTCLVRAGDAAQAQQRVLENLREYGLERPGQAARIAAVVGDLAAPRLGLADAERTRLAEQIDAIFSNGAHVSYVADYQEMRPSHVGATLELLELATRGRPKTFHHVSSVAAYYASAYRSSEVPDGAHPVHGDGIYLPYGQCKWVTDALVRSAMARGVRAVIYRTGYIGGSSQTGAWSRGDFLCRLLRGSIEMGCLPGDTHYELELTPADCVAAAIVHLAQQPSSWSRGFNVPYAEAITLHELHAILNALGHDVSLVPYSEWLERIRRRRLESLYPLLPFFQHRFQPENLGYLEITDGKRRPRLRCDETARALARAGITCPALDRALIERYIQRF